MPPLVLVTAAWVAGLVAARHWLVPLGIEPLSLVLLSLLPLAAIGFWPQDRALRLSAACALALLLGALRYQVALPNFNDPNLAAYYNDRGSVTLEGTIRRYPDVRDTWTNLSLDAEQLRQDGQILPVRGTVLVRAPRFPEYHYGDRLRVAGSLETPPKFEGFSYQDYLARSEIYSLINYPHIEKLESGQGSAFWRVIYSVKDRAREVIARLVPEPEASLLQGILLGIRTGIPPDLYDDYNATGTSHIIVISGSKDSLIQILRFRCRPGRL